MPCHFNSISIKTTTTLCEQEIQWKSEKIKMKKKVVQQICFMAFMGACDWRAVVSLLRGFFSNNKFYYSERTSIKYKSCDRK